jgi:DNA-binding NarL/FixJ family response regulator
MAQNVRVLIVEDHEIVRNGIRAVFSLEEGFEVVGEAGDGQEAFKKARDLMPDLVLMDIRMPGANGINACRAIKSKLPNTKILILTSFNDDDDIFNALNAGVSGYLLKDVQPKALLDAARAVARGEFLLHPDIVHKVVDRVSGSSRNSPKNDSSYSLTPREEEVLRLIAKGKRNSEIAQTLWISEKTVKTHVGSILRKLNQPDRTNAVLFAIRKKLV